MQVLIEATRGRPAACAGASRRPSQAATRSLIHAAVTSAPHGTMHPARPVTSAHGTRPIARTRQHAMRKLSISLRERVGRPSARDEAAVVQHDHGVGEARREREIMRDDDHQRPLSAASRSRCMTSIWWRGSSEAVGSSAKITGASTASTRASATRLRSPPESSVTGRSRKRRDVGRRHRAIDGRGVVGRSRDGIGRAVRIAPERHDVARRQRPVHVLALRQIGKARARARAGRATTARAVDAHRALRRGNSPASARSSVVLPAPFGPTSATTCAPAARAKAAPPPAAAEPDAQTFGLQIAPLMRRLRRARGARARSGRGRTARR